MLPVLHASCGGGSYMLHNLLLTKDNLARRRIITTEAQNCFGNCGSLEDMDHLFMRCDFYHNLWPL